MARTEAEKKAQKKYYLKNKSKYRIISYRSKAKNFILKHATTDELIWLRDLIDKRLSKSKVYVDNLKQGGNYGKKRK